ncbi:unnamed protein product [Paramecium pentaurelia]|uniref:Uncharacterized protein n=1 Tax=Paramecium pentaurelia TaxID=43138 RepID=A0A8S1YI35_9CILI|nr:unnamed protein product [Paramecium pentaurelia]
MTFLTYLSLMICKNTLFNNQFVLNVLDNVYNIQIVHLTAIHADLNKITNIVGLYSNFETNTCYYKGGDGIMSLDEECDDSNVLNGNDRTCRLEQQFICKDSVCIKPELPILILIQAGDQSIYNNVRLFNYNITYSYNLTMIQILIRMLKYSFQMVKKKQIQNNNVTSPSI